MKNEKNFYDETFVYIVTEFFKCNNGKTYEIMEICDVFNDYLTHKINCDFNEIIILDFYFSNLKESLKINNLKFNEQNFSNIFNINCIEYGFNESIMEICNDYKVEISKLENTLSKMLTKKSIVQMTIMEMIMFIQSI